MRCLRMLFSRLDPATAASWCPGGAEAVVASSTAASSPAMLGREVSSGSTAGAPGKRSPGLTRSCLEEASFGCSGTARVEFHSEAKAEGKLQETTVKRIMPRDMPLSQSWGRFNIQKEGVSNRLLMESSFHMVLQLQTWKLISLCLSVYTLTWLLFAAWWLNVAEPCDISLASYREALYLSIETMMTIGFGVDDPFFNDCYEALPLIFCQSFSGLLLDIMIVGVIFQRFSRAYSRAATIIFSDNALIRERARASNSKAHLAFRIVEMQETPLLQCTLQAYCVLHRKDLQRDEAEGYDVESSYITPLNDDVPEDIEEVVIKPLKLQQLDTTNTVLCCGLPMTVSHTIDRYSPLAPCNRYQMRCDRDPTPEEVYTNMWGSPEEGGGGVRPIPYLEVIVILSGVEEITGASVEGRQSYTKDEILFGQEFASCVSLGKNGRHKVDFGKFQDTSLARSMSVPPSHAEYYRARSGSGGTPASRRARAEERGSGGTPGSSGTPRTRAAPRTP